MFKRWLKGTPAPQAVRVGEVSFLGEQDGVPERGLKRELLVLFQSRPYIELAHLAVVHYQSESERSIALCVSGVDELHRGEIVEAVSKIFAKMFGAHEHLDVLFPTGRQKEQLSRICRAFYPVQSEALETVNKIDR